MYIYILIFYKKNNHICFKTTQIFTSNYFFFQRFQGIDIDTHMSVEEIVSEVRSIVGKARKVSDNI